MCANPNPRYDPRGSLWHRWDLHFHTPSSFEYHDFSITNKQIIEVLVENGVDVVAITDHHKIDVQRIKDLQKLGGERITVLPGIELRDEHGDKPIHYICIFPEDIDLDHVWTIIKGTFKLTSQGLEEQGGDEGVYVPISQGAKLARDLGGVVSIHAGEKSNSIDGISNNAQFQQRIKYNITKDFVDLIEIGQLKDIDSYLSIVFPDTGLDKPLVICSDCHNALNYSVKVPLWLRADPTFRGLLMVMRESRDRVYIGGRPPQLARKEQNPTKYINSVSIHRKEGAPPSEQWFDGKIFFNPGLVAIVGNKGSGKSALSDTLGLLGATKNTDSFSFLCTDRFCHPVAGHSTHYEATVIWESGEEVTLCLNDHIKPEEVERLKYLPQNHVEKICNELAELEEGGFEEELDAVIFSHVPESQRLGYNNFGDLIRFRNGEKQKRIDTLLTQLRETSRIRAILEDGNDPIFKRSVNKQIEQKTKELVAHDKAKPPEVPNPADIEAGGEQDSTVLAELAAMQEEKAKITKEIDDTSKRLRDAERRLAVAVRLEEMLGNFRKEFEAFKESLSKDAAEVSLKADNLIAISVDLSGIEKLKTESNIEIMESKGFLEDPGTAGVQKRLSNLEVRIIEIQSKLDAPNKVYQAYVQSVADWQQRRLEIVGSESDAESLTGLKLKLSELGLLPQRIDEQKEKQILLAVEIHKEKQGQVAVYRELYEPVQQFIDSHPLATEQLKIEFHAELTNEGFSESLLNLLALNRKGSFMGIDEGRAKIEEFVQKTDCNEIEPMKEFIKNIDKALHEDQREKSLTATQLKDQVVKGVRPEEVFNLLYGLEYVRSKYVLRWEGKDLEMLSPGERGTLLVVFYLLIEKGNMPLIIDQPEGNLDNLTITQTLVDCIKAARSQRQVFIVTHNPNLAVVCDADQVVYASMEKIGGVHVEYKTGSLENPIMSLHVTDVLEGTRKAFGVRGGKYRAAQDKK